MVIFILIINVLLVFKLWWDFRAKKSGRIINHEFSALVDGIIYLVSGWLLFGFLDLAGWFILAVGYRWLTFDLFFNLINKDKWNHYGRSSKLDRFLLKLGKFHLLPKILLIMIGIWLIKR